MKARPQVFVRLPLVLACVVGTRTLGQFSLEHAQQEGIALQQVTGIAHCLLQKVYESWGGDRS